MEIVLKRGSLTARVEALETELKKEKEKNGNPSL